MNKKFAVADSSIIPKMKILHMRFKVFTVVLRHDTVKSGRLLPVFQRNLIEGTLVMIYKSTQCHNPEGGNLHPVPAGTNCHLVTGFKYLTTVAPVTL